MKRAAGRFSSRTVSSLMRPDGDRVHIRMMGRVEIAEVAGPQRAARHGEAQESGPRLLIEGHPTTGAAGPLGQLVDQVGLDILGPVAQAGQAKGPQIDAGQEIFAKLALDHGLAEFAVGSGDELKVAGLFLVRSDRQERLLFDGAQKHGLLVGPQLADLVEKEHPAVGRAQESGPVALRPGESPLDVTEERRHGGVAAQSRAVDSYEWARNLSPCTFELVDALGQLRLAGPGRPHEQHGRVRGDS